jgi:hypothetical protein
VPVDTVFQSLRQDVRYAFRGLARNPMFTATAILAAALGIGSTTAVFSVVDRILFRSLPYPDEDRLVSVGMLAPIDSNEFLFPDAYFDLRRNQTPFESITSFTAGVAGCDLSEANPVRLGCAQVEGNFLPALGLAPFLGRNFTAAEDRRGAPKVALMSYALWQSRYGRDPGVAGKVLSIDGGPVTIVGVLPRNFELPTLAQADLVLPEALNEATEHNGRALRVFAKLKPGVSIAQARAALEPSFQRMLSTVPAAFRREISLRVRSLRDRQVQDARLASWVLLGSVVAVLLIACANIANLLLAGRSRGFGSQPSAIGAAGPHRERLARDSRRRRGLWICLGAASAVRGNRAARDPAIGAGVAGCARACVRGGRGDDRRAAFRTRAGFPEPGRRSADGIAFHRRAPDLASRIAGGSPDRGVGGFAGGRRDAAAQFVETRKRASRSRIGTRGHR